MRIVVTLAPCLGQLLRVEKSFVHFFVVGIHLCADARTKLTTLYANLKQ